MTEIREYTPQYRQIWIINGPVFHRHDHLRRGEEIPDACYKIICREQDGQTRSSGVHHATGRHGHGIARPAPDKRP